MIKNRLKWKKSATPICLMSVDICYRVMYLLTDTCRHESGRCRTILPFLIYFYYFKMGCCPDVLLAAVVNIFKGRTCLFSCSSSSAGGGMFAPCLWLPSHIIAYSCRDTHRHCTTSNSWIIVQSAGTSFEDSYHSFWWNFRHQPIVWWPLSPEKTSSIKNGCESINQYFVVWSFVSLLLHFPFEWNWRNIVKLY